MSEEFNKARLIRQVDLFALKLFLTVVEERQVGRAAARENIAASAATKRIQDLEELVGVPLFERNPKGVAPTPAGLVLARHVGAMLAIVEDIRRDISQFTQGVRGNIRVASTGAIIFQFLSRDIAEFAQSFPLVDIDLREFTNPEVVRVLAAGEVDVAVFVATPEVKDADIDAFDYRTDRLVALVPAGHALADRPQVKIRDLFQHNLIAVSLSTTMMANVRKAAAQEGIEFKPKYVVNSVYAATSLVRAGLGVTLAPDYMLSAQDAEWVRTVPLDEPWAQRHLRVATLRHRPRTAATRSFLAQLTSRAL